MIVKRLLRVLATPIRRLLDGRFADVNRRIESVRLAVSQQEEVVAELGRNLAAYSATQDEATSFTAVQLRRLEDGLFAHEERIAGDVRAILEAIERLDTRSYVKRLVCTSRGPLAELDGSLADAVNYTNGHQGLLAKAGMWFNPPVTVELSEGSARIAGVNERIVELPFACGLLARLEVPARILDVGGAESTFALSAASLGHHVTLVDPQGAPFQHPNLTVVRSRLEEWVAPPERFDAAFVISAIEHFGLGAYGESSVAGRADRAALERLRSLLVDGGLLVLTTPFGESSVNELERTYDEADLQELLAGWKIVERRTVARADETTWLPAEAPGNTATALIAATASASA